MTTDHTPAEAGTDPRVGILAEGTMEPEQWRALDEPSRNFVRDGARAMLARLDAARPSVVPGDTATEGGDVKLRALRVIERDAPNRAQVGGKTVTAADAAAALAAAGLLATAGTEGEAEDRAAKLEDSDVRVWQRTDGRLAIRDKHRRYGADVLWLDDMDSPPADARPLLPAPRAVAPAGNVDRDAVVQLAVDRYEAEHPNAHLVPLQWLRLGVDVALDTPELAQRIVESVNGAAPRVVAPAGNVDRDVDSIREVRDMLAAYDVGGDAEVTLSTNTLGTAVAELDVVLAALRAEKKGGDDA